MKTSLKKLQKFTALKHDRRRQKQHQFLALDELARATQDMNDMRDCYDRLLSAAAATANNVYEFSLSLQEMGDCLLEKTALNDDEESGKVLLMLGKVQFELQKLVDGYRSHIFQTITIPSESLLNELRIVEEMKKRCDGKREIYEELLKKQKEKGKSRNSKGESFTSSQLQEAHDEYDEDANVFVFRMKSLKQGQSRSFLTQASRHHAAQLSFFKKAVKSLEAIEPHVRLLAEQQHIDYQFIGLKDYGHGVSDDDDYDDDESYGDDDSDDDSESQDDGELSFDHGPVQEGSTLKNSMELDSTDAPSPPDIKLSATRDFPRSPRRNSFSFQTAVRVSKSAPLFPEKKLDSSQIGPSPSRKFASYVLPTPAETKRVVSGKLSTDNPQTKLHPILSHRHSSPLDPKKYEKLLTEKSSGPVILDAQSVLRDSNTNTNTNSNKGNPSPLPSPLSEGFSFKQPDPNVGSYAKKAKRQAFSGPLTGKPWPNNPNLTSSGPIAHTHYRSPFSGSLLRTPIPRPASTPKLSSRASSTFVSSPKISELHELPRPPPNLEALRRPVNRFAHSGPLISQTHEMSTSSVSAASAAASILPTPPQALSRSFSIPAGGPQEAALRVPLEGSENVKMAEDASSPPLTPVSFSSAHSGSPTS